MRFSTGRLRHGCSAGRVWGTSRYGYNRYCTLLYMSVAIVTDRVAYPGFGLVNANSFMALSCFFFLGRTCVARNAGSPAPPPGLRPGAWQSLIAGQLRCVIREFGTLGPLIGVIEVGAQRGSKRSVSDCIPVPGTRKNVAASSQDARLRARASCCCQHPTARKVLGCC